MIERECLPPRRRLEIIEGEHAGIRFTAGIGRFPDGRVAELFMDTGKPGCQAETAARDAAIILSLALQHGTPVEAVRHALTRLSNGKAAGPVGHVLDLIAGA